MYCACVRNGDFFAYVRNGDFLRTYVVGIGSIAMEMLGNVMGILDMDGFYIWGQFFCKDLGMWKVGDVYARSYLFDIGGGTWMRKQVSNVIT